MRWKQAAREGALLGMTALLMAAAPAHAPALAALARIEPGAWQIKPLGGDTPARSVCVSDPAVLLHFGHRSNGCEGSVLVDRPDVATVQYRCTGSATGRTTVRVATPHAFNLDLQGLDGGLPYDESFEAHRIGACGAGAH